MKWRQWTGSLLDLISSECKQLAFCPFLRPCCHKTLCHQHKSLAKHGQEQGITPLGGFGPGQGELTWGEPVGWAYGVSLRAALQQCSWISTARPKLTPGRVLGCDGIKLDISSKSSISWRVAPQCLLVLLGQVASRERTLCVLLPFIPSPKTFEYEQGGPWLCGWALEGETAVSCRYLQVEP